MSPCSQLRFRAPLERAVLLIVLAAMSGCDYPTTAPLLDVRWVFPIEDQSISVVELLPANVDTVGGSFQVGVDPFSVNQTLGGLCPACIFFDGQMVLKPAFSVTYQDIGTLPTDVVSVEMESGAISLGIQNNLGFDPMAYLDAIPAERVGQIHLAGFSDMGGYLFDSHSRPVSEPVWVLYADVLRRMGRRTTMVEWDAEIPEWPQLVTEIDKARAVADRVFAQPVSEYATVAL